MNFLARAGLWFRPIPLIILLSILTSFEVNLLSYNICFTFDSFVQSPPVSVYSIPSTAAFNMFVARLCSTDICYDVESPGRLGLGNTALAPVTQLTDTSSWLLFINFLNIWIFCDTEYVKHSFSVIPDAYNALSITSFILLSCLVCLYQFLDCIDKRLHCILRKNNQNSLVSIKLPFNVSPGTPPAPPPPTRPSRPSRR